MTIRAITKQLDLWGNEALVFEYLASLYYHGQLWKGSMKKLGEESRVGSIQTVSRVIDKLAQQGLVEKCGTTISLIKQEVLDLIGNKQFQNGNNNVQNGSKNFQNGNLVQEKEKKQKKKENMKEKESENNNTHTRTLVFDKNKIFEPPVWKDWFQFGQDNDIPYVTCKKAWCFYMMRGWKDVRNWKAALMYWDLKDKT